MTPICTTTTNFNRRRRRAFTLVEVLVVVALSSLLLGVVISVVQGLIRRDQATRAGSPRNEQLAALAEVLRTDIRRGSDVSLATDDTLLVAFPAGETARYQLDSGGCRRKVTRTGDETAYTDLYDIGRGTTWKIERDYSGRRPLVLATLERAADNYPHTALVPLSVEAVLGADSALGAAPPLESAGQ